MNKLPELTPARRRWLYDVGIAAVALAVVYALVDGETADAWIAVLGAALGVARSNVPSEH
ncbi:hypothetical protein [Nocardioides pantholopis]|uniref:hypothetical protein n=1 Tax=Nocardioides pantholopis TaxID=2483798 RepID=UPI0019D0302B|nr:hypothetical protein [Nocardioides pantholopis]